MRISLRKSISIVLFLMLVSLSCIFVVSDAIVLRFARERIYQDTQDTVVLYQKQMDNDLDRIDNYLYTVMSQNSSFIRLSYMKGTDPAWYSPVSILGAGAEEFDLQLQGGSLL